MENTSRSLWTRRGDPWGVLKHEMGLKIHDWFTCMLLKHPMTAGYITHAFITSHLDYCNLILSGVPSKALDNSRMNYASRVLSGTKASHQPQPSTPTASESIPAAPLLHQQNTPRSCFTLSPKSPQPILLIPDSSVHWHQPSPFTPISESSETDIWVSQPEPFWNITSKGP